MLNEKKFMSYYRWAQVVCAIMSQIADDIGIITPIPDMVMVPTVARDYAFPFMFLKKDDTPAKSLSDTTDIKKFIDSHIISFGEVASLVVEMDECFVVIFKAVN